MKLEAQRLPGRVVSLDPVGPDMKEEVRALVHSDREAWEIMRENALDEHFESYWSEMCGASRGERVPYVIRHSADGRIVGVSTFYTQMQNEGGVEIGSTFLHPEVRSGAVNPEAKLLMLEHAFRCGAVRVQFRVDTRNRRSQAAVAKLGAVREGVLRRDRVTWNGYLRDTAYFSILDREWPAVKSRLEQRLEASKRQAAERE
jgi:RimJ/RimL family protein N-acetyltransferase